MEDYIVSARKYRPVTFDSVVGQKALTTTLKNAISSGKLANTYLFCGPRGVGKTTCARIFAKTINCTNRGADGEACGECESCRSFNEELRSYNVFELDAASNNSVDDIRNLTEQVRIPPMNGKYKVYIIDEVHMLSQAAFNAFLKTLEEPPPQTLIILVTEQPSRLLPTILSRCVRLDLRSANPGLHLSRVQELFLPAVCQALEKLGSDVAALALRADFQNLLTNRRESITKKLTAAIKAESKAIAEGTDIRDWEARQKDATAALIETEYLAEREQMLELLILCLGQAVLLASHAPDVQPLSPVLAQVAQKHSVEALLRRMRAVEALRSDLNFNVAEALALDSRLLDIIGNNSLL